MKTTNMNFFLFLIIVSFTYSCGGSGQGTADSANDSKSKSSVETPAADTTLDGVWLANFGYGGQSVLVFTIVGTDVYFEDFFMCSPSETEPKPFYKLTKKSETIYQLDVNLDNACASSMNGLGSPNMPLPKQVEVKLDGSVPTKEMSFPRDNESNSLVRIHGASGRFKYWETEAMKKYRGI